MRKKTRTATGAKQSIVSAFVELIQEKAYADISITDIVKRADVSRMTYYRSFSSKEEIVENYLTHWLVQLSEQIEGRSHIDMTEVYQLIFGTMAENRSFFQSITSSGLTDLIISSIIRHSYDIVRDYYGWREDDRAEIYGFYYHIGGLIVIARSWFEEGMSESVEEIARIACNITGRVYPKGEV